MQAHHAHTTPNDIRSALAYIPADDRDTWLRIGMAIRTELGDDGFSLWDSWSQSADNYNERAARDVWRSLKGGGVGIGTLFYIAQQHGWRRDAPSRPISVAAPKPPPPPQTGDTARYALELWLRADPAGVASHPYARAKGIDWPAGAGRTIASGRVVGRDADCLIIPIRDLSTDKVVAAQAINAAGAKQTFGRVSGHAFICGNTLNRKIRWFVSEGWADAVSLVFHHYCGNAVALAACGKSMMRAVAERAAEVYAPNQLVILEDAA